MPTPGQTQPQRPVVEGLEAKLLYSADLGLSAFTPTSEAAHQQTLPTQETQASMSVIDSQADMVAQQPAREIAFIDESVTDLAGLVHDIEQQAAQGRAIEVVVIRADEDGIARITQTLQDQQHITAVHLIGHGYAGGMHLGTAELDAQSLMNRAGDIAQWGSALSADGDLLLYGCDVALGTPGHALLEGLTSLTGADVAASDDLTGSANLGGDWMLEVQSGQIDSATAISATKQAQWEALLLQATPSSKGTAIWAESGDAAAQQGNWDGLTLSDQTNTATLSTWTVMTSASSPTRNEAIAVGVDANGTIRAQRWDGTQWTALPTNPLATGTVTDRQGFAVAYEQSSGDAVLVWNNGTALRYSVFNGSTWTTASTISAYTGTAPQQMRLVANPISDGMVLVVSDASGDDRALVWNGSSWGNAIPLDDTGTGSADQLSTAVAYESQSGHAMVAYAKAGNANVYYRMFNGSSWSSEAAVGSFAEAATPLWVTLASDPTSDRIGLGVLSIGAGDTSQVSLAVWGGSSWGTRLVANSYADQTPGASVALAFESRSGDLLAVYASADSAVRYRTWTSGGGWSAESFGPTTGHLGAARLFADPQTNHIMMGVQAENGVISFTAWNGSAFGSTETVTTGSGSIVTPAFTWLWQNDVQGNKTNTLLVGSNTDGSDWRGVNDISDTEVLEFGNPGVSYGDGNTYGSFSHLVNLEAMGAQGVDDIVMVSQNLTITGSINVQRGDLLFTTTSASTLVNADGSTLAVNEDDVVRFRPAVAGDYSSGTFTILVQALGSTRVGASPVTIRGPNVRGLALVEQSTTVAGRTLAAGTLIFTAGTGTAAAEIQYLTLGSGSLLGGLLVGANATTLITGSNVNINQAITGLEVISTSTPMANVTLNAGSLLFTLEQADNNVGNVGSPVSVNKGDVVILTPANASQATATIMLRGSQVGINDQAFDSLAISRDAAPVITSNSGGTTASISVTENTTAVTTVVAPDVDGDTLSYSITGGTDASRFQINATTGVLSFGSAMNFEDPISAANSNAYQVIVSASDGTYADTQTITVNVTNVDEAPVIAPPPGMGNFFGLNVLKAPLGSANILSIRASDPEGQAVTYSISGSAAFTVNATTGLVQLQSPQNYQDGDDFYLTLIARDPGGKQSTLSLFIELDSSVSAANNDTPAISGGSAPTVSVVEEQTLVTTIAASDSDHDAVITYAITSGFGNASLFQINAVTGELRFKDAPVYSSSGTNSYSVRVTASDGTNSDTQTLTVNVLDHNDPPTNTLPASYSTSEDSAVSLTGISVADTDAASSSITVTFSVQYGTLTALNSVSGGVGSGGISYASGNRQVTLTGTASAINTTLANANGLRYQADSNYAGADTLTMVSNDQGNSGVAYAPAVTTDTDTAVIVVSHVADATVATATVGTQSYTENAAATPIDAGITLNDVDGASITGATVRITGNYLSSQDVLSFVTQGGITGTWDAGTGTMTLSGSGTLSQWQAALRAVSYNNTSDNPNTSARTVTFSVVDSGTTVSTTRGISITAVNDLPALTGTGSTLAYTENAAATAIDPGLSISDIDSTTFSSATVQITGNHVSAEDVLSFTNQLGITGTWNATTGTLTLSGSASAANYQTALRSVTYRNSSDNPSTATRTVTFSIIESNGTGSSARSIAISAVNDAPIVTTTSGAQTHQFSDPPTVVDPTLVLSDPDNATLTGATVRITTNYDSGDDVLGFTNQAGITGSWNAGTGTLTLSGTASVAAYQAALRSVTFDIEGTLLVSNAQRTISFTVNDGSGDVSASRAMQVTSNNAAPNLGTTGTPLAYTEGDTVVVDGGLTLTDGDSPTLSLATVRITGNHAADQDVLAFTDQLGLTGSWDAATGTLTLSGSASPADMRAALRSITYTNTSDDPDTTARTITFTVVDGGNSASATRNIAITAVNDAPVASTSSGALQYTENEAAKAIDPGLNFTDPDAAVIAGATVQITGNHAAGEDVLSFTNQFGITGAWNAATGTLTLTGNASPADYQAALRSVAYANSSNAPDTSTRTVTYTISDGSLSAVATRDIAITATNDAPTLITSGAALSYAEGTGPSPVDVGLLLGDVDNASLSGAIVQITGRYLDDQDTLSFTDQLGITGSWDDVTGTLTLSGTASVADYQAALRSVAYLNSSDTPDTLTRTVTFTISDGGDTSNGSRQIAITAQDDAPTLTASVGSATHTEGTAPTVIDAALILSDVDTDTFSSATVHITGNHRSGEDALAFTDQLGITGSWDAANGLLTLSGSASAADYQTALSSITYNNTADAPDTAQRTITFGISDGTTSVTAQRTVNVVAVGDAPVLTTTATPLSYTENAPPTAIDPALTLSDPDGNPAAFIGATVQITGNHSADQDLLAFTPQLGITSTWNDTSGTLTLNGAVSMADYEAALRSITYVNTSDHPDTATRTITFNFHSSDGTASATRDITITAVNDASVLSTTTTPLAYTENDSATAIDPALTLTDVDATTLTSATVRIGIGYINGQDVLAFTDQGGITGAWNSSNGTLTLTGNGSSADYQAALRSVTYVNLSDDPTTTTRSIVFSLNDGTGTIEATRDIALTAVNDAATMATTGSTLPYTENDAATAIDTGLTLSDVDTTTLTSATIRISGAYQGSEDTLTFTAQSGITGSWDTTTGTLTLSGTASIADYQAALRSVAYVNSADNPDASTRTITFSVNDGNGDVTATRAIAITAVNDAPQPVTTGSALAYTENDDATVIDPALTLSDADHSMLSDATVQISTQYTAGEDTLRYTDQLGITGTWNATTGTLTLSGTASVADYQAALRSVTYDNSSDDPNSATRTITFSVSDGQASGTATRDIAFTAVDDAPVMATTGTPLGYTENDAATAIDSALSLTDVDAGLLTGATVQITGNFATGEDVLAFTDQLGITGSWNAATGTLTLTGNASAVDYEAALRSVTYRNTSDDPDTATRTIQFDVPHAGGNASATRTITVTAVNDAPSLAIAGPVLSYTENDAPTPVAPSLSLSDIDTPTLSGATVQITAQYAQSEDVLAFTAQSGITGTWDASTGTLSLSGTASIASYEAALRSITYHNTSDNPQTATRTVTFQVDDGTGPTTATQGIQVTAVNDAPQLVSNSLSVVQGSIATPVIVITDPDNTAANLTITVGDLISGQFIDTQTSTVVTSFTYSDVQDGHIAFQHDGSLTSPSYTLTISDGQSTSTSAPGSVEFLPIPLPAPTSPPTDNSTPEPTEEAPTTTDQDSAEDETTQTDASTANLSQAEQALAQAAPGAGLESLRSPTLERDRPDTVNQNRFLVEAQAMEPTRPQPVAAPLNIDSFRLNWSGDLQTLINAEELRRNLDVLQEQLLEQSGDRRNVVASSIALTTGLSVGYVIWLVRGGALLGSMLSAMPAWQMIDPLPVLTRGRAQAGLPSDGDDDAPIEHLFDDHNDAPDDVRVDMGNDTPEPFDEMPPPMSASTAVQPEIRS